MKSQLGRFAPEGVTQYVSNNITLRHKIKLQKYMYNSRDDIPSSTGWAKSSFETPYKNSMAWGYVPADAPGASPVYAYYTYYGLNKENVVYLYSFSSTSPGKGYLKADLSPYALFKDTSVAFYAYKKISRGLYPVFAFTYARAGFPFMVYSMTMNLPGTGLVPATWGTIKPEQHIAWYAPVPVH